MKSGFKYKKIYHIYLEDYGEMDFFFDQKYKYLHHWNRNDADFRDEYMNPLFEKIGFEIVEADFEDKRFHDKIIKALEESGVDTEDEIWN